MKRLNTALKTCPVVYVCRDVERALGVLPEGDYRIVTNESPYAISVRDQSPKGTFLLIKGERPLDTNELLEKDDVRSFIGESSVIVFKSTRNIERTCAKYSIKLLNPNASLALTIEEKVSQIDWLKESSCHLPPHEVLPLGSIEWNDSAFIIQFNHAHTGGGTFLIQSKEDLEKIQAPFPKRIVRKMAFIEGPSYTVNNCVVKTTGGTQILMGNISYQITGLPPFTNKRFSTIGNDWGFAHNHLSDNQKQAILKISKEIGGRLAQDNWLGLFGLDFIISKKTGEVFLIEINARQPASTTLESKLQRDAREKSPSKNLTLAEAHILALTKTELDLQTSIIPITDGAQIVQRVSTTYPKIIPADISFLKDLGYTVITYEDQTHNADLVRIQSSKSIMKEHEIFHVEMDKIIQRFS